MRGLPFLLLAALAAAPVQSAPREKGPTIQARPLRLDPADPAHLRYGSLRLLGAWQLTSPDKRFGSISSLSVHGGRFVALSDDGMLFRFRMNGRGRIGEVRFQPLPAVPVANGTKSDRDSESMQFDPATGRAWVGFEQHNQIWRYAVDFTRAEAHAAPAAMQGWPGNGGPEAMARLPDGRFIVFAEEAQGPDPATREALLFAGDPTEGAAPVRFFYRPPAGYVPTDAAMLSDGRLLVLNRHFTPADGASAALVVVDPGAIEPGQVLEGREIARLAPPLAVDNMEGLSVEQERGRTVLWLVSDDNYNAFQRTILLKFALEEGR